VQRDRARWLNALRIVAAATALILFARVLAAADVRRVAELVHGVGVAGVALVLVPPFLALSCEAYGWKIAFAALGRRVRFRPLLRVRIATEALAQSLPLGVAFAESTKPHLLGRHCGLGVAEAVAGMAARKYLLLASQSVYVLVLSAGGFAALQGASKTLIGVPGLGYFACAAGAALGAAALFIALTLRKSELARGTFALLQRIPGARLRGWLSRREPAFVATDGAVARFFRADARRTFPAGVAFGAAWFIESLETYLILRLLGVELDFATVASFEVVLSLVRNVVFVLPAGLGVQDLGYVACFAACGVPHAASVGAAFVLLKRAKELFWIALGYGFLLSDVTPAAAEPGSRVRATKSRWGSSAASALVASSRGR
jgi:hypothetical protein